MWQEQERQPNDYDAARRGAARRRGDGRMGIGMGMGLGGGEPRGLGLQEGREELDPEVRTVGGTEMVDGKDVERGNVEQERW